jgi:hypothetical protein
MTADVQRELAEALVDELSGWPIGSGYYSTTVGTDDAREMVERLLPLIAEAHAPGKCVSVEDANRVLAEERAGVQRLIADAEERAAAAALREAADWLDTDPDKGGAPYITDDGSVLFPHRLDIAEVVTWAAASLRDRAAELDPS